VHESDRPRRRLLVVNGPNLNLLGTREPDVYGLTSLDAVEAAAREAAGRCGFEVRALQSNHEGVLLDAIHQAGNDCAGIVINAGAYSHTSIALRDALAAVSLPVVEVHLSNVYRREAFRQHSYISGVADAIVIGAGVHGYAFAVEHLAQLIG